MSPLSKDNITGSGTGARGVGISECLDVGKDFLKGCTLSNECRIQDLLIISCCFARQHSHIPTTVGDA